MSSRNNFLDADNSTMERNLRFVKNDLEDNLNQYFSGPGDSRGNNTGILAPPRDYKVVQPKPGGYHALNPGHDLEESKQFLLQIGLARHEAYNLIKASDFDVTHYMDKRSNWLKAGLTEKQVNNLILFEINNNADDGHQNRSFRKANEGDLERCNSGPNEINYTNKRMSNYQNTSHYQIDNNIDFPGFSAMPQENSYNLKSSHASKPAPHMQGLQPMEHETEFRKVGGHFRSSMSPSRDFNSIQQEFKYIADRAFERSNEKYQYRSNASSQMSSNQNDGLQRYVNKSGFNKRQHDENATIKNVSPSLPCGFNSMQQERGRSKDINNFRSSQPSILGSPPRGFNSMQLERSSNSNQLSRMLLNSNQCNTLLDRGSSKFVEPLNIMGSEPSSITSTYGGNLDYENVSKFQQNQLGFGNKLTKANVVSLMGEYKELYKRRQDISDQDFGNPMKWRDNSTNIPPLMGCNNATSYDNQSQRHWIGAGNTTNIPPLKAYNNAPYGIGAGNFKNIPPLMGYNNASSYENKSQGYGSNSNISLSVDDTKQFKSIPSLLSLPFSMTEIMKNPPLTPRQIENSKEQQKFSKKLKIEKKNERLLDAYKKTNSNCPLILCDFKNPQTDRSKDNPQAYWSQWWPRYKYVEKTLQKTSILLKPQPLPRSQKNLQLRIGVNKILRNIDLTEKDYAYRDTFELFKYKKHFENPIFQKYLEHSELLCVQSALAQLQNKTTMALLHQSLISKWHFSLDIIKRAKAGELVESKNAFNLLSDRTFNYFVMESIQQLKAISKAEWPEFKEFYNSIRTTNDETDIFTMIFNNSATRTTENDSMANEAY